MFKTQIRNAINIEKQLYLKLHAKATWRVNVITQCQINSTVLSKRKRREVEGSSQQPGACGAATSLAEPAGDAPEGKDSRELSLPRKLAAQVSIDCTVRVPQRSTSSTHSLSWCPVTLAQAKMGGGGMRQLSAHPPPLCI